jgi:hypothetical protein
MNPVASRIADNLEWPGILAHPLSERNTARLKRELLRIASNDEFVHLAYQFALGRDVNPIELQRQLWRLRRIPFYRRFMLYRLFRSPEAREKIERLNEERLGYLEELWQSLRQDQQQHHHEQLRLLAALRQEQQRLHEELVRLGQTGRPVFRGESRCAS